MDLKSQSMGRRKNRIALCCLLMLLAITGCSKQETMETVKIENSTYTKAQIYEHVATALSGNDNDGFGLWEVKDEPYRCIFGGNTAFYSPRIIGLFNRALKVVNTTPIKILPCQAAIANKKTGIKPKGSMIFIYAEDFSQINDVMDTGSIVGHKLSKQTIKKLNKEGGGVEFSGYDHPRSYSYRLYNTTMTRLLGSYPMGKVGHIFVRDIYSMLLRVRRSDVIKESIMHSGSTRVDLSSIDQYYLKASYELSGTGLTIEEARIEVAKRVFNALKEEIVIGKKHDG